jgi:hypothetical protein
VLIRLLEASPLNAYLGKCLSDRSHWPTSSDQLPAAARRLMVVAQLLAFILSPHHRKPQPLLPDLW